MAFMHSQLMCRWVVCPHCMVSHRIDAGSTWMLCSTLTQFTLVMDLTFGAVICTVKYACSPDCPYYFAFCQLCYKQQILGTHNLNEAPRLGACLISNQFFLVDQLINSISADLQSMLAERERNGQLCLSIAQTQSDISNLHITEIYKQGVLNSTTV